MKKLNLSLIVLLMVIGFAATTITLQVKGYINLFFDEDTFESSIIFSSVKSNDGTTTLLEQDTIFTLDTKEFTEVGDTATVDFIITNNSEHYDAEVLIECGLKEESKLFENYVTIEGLPEEPISLKSGKSDFESLTIKYSQQTAAESFEVGIACKIDPTALPKAEVDDSDEKYTVSLLVEGNGKVEVKKDNEKVDPPILEIAQGEIDQFTATPEVGYYLSSVSCINGYKILAEVGKEKTLEQTITVFNSRLEIEDECTIVFEQLLDESEEDEFEYSIGNEVQIYNDDILEDFYVIKDSDISEPTVTLISKYAIDTSTYKQSDPARAIKFVTTIDWKSWCTSGSCKLIDDVEPSENYVALYHAYWYGQKLGVKGRLLYYSEYYALKDVNSDQANGTYASNGYINYWLNQVNSNGYAYAVRSKSTYLDKNSTLVNGCGLRPVIEVPKSLIVHE
ncbi:MAG: hypothetical protein J1F35_05490 [Erysipelotrichales bacterium]|nr:hypothetical protein [Erysipelotrichales bacterium]